MKVVKNPLEAYAHVDHWRREGLKIGLIPTMGALHAGHFSLVDRSVEECDITAATIFVNPTQFGPYEDLDRYPRTLEEDLAGLKDRGTDLVFVPTNDALYPEGFSTFVGEPANAKMLEGEHRPGHFQGVVTIVLKLFQILPATIAYFGQKDFQQLAVIRQMATDLNVPIRVEGCPTIREEDGLAMSSRNRYLSAEDRTRALCLSEALNEARKIWSAGERASAKLEEAMHRVLESSVDSLEYARVVDSQSLEAVEIAEKPVVALIAARVGNTRLIDNTVLE